MEVNHCPKCKNYILGPFCYICNIYVNEYYEDPFKGTPFEKIFGDYLKGR